MGRLRYLKSHEVDMRGHVERTLKYMLDTMTEAGLKEDLLMILSAVAYAEENGFKIEVEEGYFEAGKMVLRSFRILEV